MAGEQKSRDVKKERAKKTEPEHIILPNVKNQLLSQVNKESQINPNKIDDLHFFSSFNCFTKFQQPSRRVPPFKPVVSFIFFSRKGQNERKIFFFFIFYQKSIYKASISRSEV